VCISLLVWRLGPVWALGTFGALKVAKEGTPFRELADAVCNWARQAVSPKKVAPVLLAYAK